MVPRTSISSLSGCTLLALLSIFAVASLLIGIDPANAQLGIDVTESSVCMDDLYPGDLNCTANDIQVARASNIVMIDDGCAWPGDTVTFSADFEVVLSARERYDIGLYFATDGDPNGDGALTGDCSLSTLPTDYVDLDADFCGDLDGAHSPLNLPLTLTALCVDPDNDGRLNLPYCTTWRQPGANEVCNQASAAIPGSPSKCRCDLGFNIDILVPPAQLSVVKTADPENVNEPGALVTFTVEVTNQSPFASVELTSLNDTIYGDLSDLGCTLPSTIEHGDTYTCSFSTYVMGNGASAATSTVTAEGIDENDNIVTGADDATVVIDNVSPSIEIVKTADPTWVWEPGDNVNFTVAIANNSVPGDPVTITSLVDDLHGDLDGQGDCTMPVTLQPGDEYSCTFSALETGNAGDVNVDVVTALFTDDEGTEKFAVGSATVNINDVLPTIEVTKVAYPTSVDEPSGDVTFTVLVNNLSTAELVTIDSLSDNPFGDITYLHDDIISTTCSVPHNLGPYDPVGEGDLYTCSFTATLSGTPGDIIVDLLTASGHDDENNYVTDDDSAAITIIDVPSSIKVTKTADPTEVDEPGGDVIFSITVTNTSAVDEVTITNLDDDIYGDVTDSNNAKLISTDCSAGQILAPSDPDSNADSYTCSFTAHVSANGTGVETDTITASGSDDDGSPVSNKASATVTIHNLASSIEVTKTASATTVNEPGGEVTFSVTVKNTSAVDDVTITGLSDDVHGDLNGQGTCDVGMTLAPGASYDCSFTANVSGNAGDSETDTVTASGQDDDLIDISADSDPITVTIADVPSSIEVTKAASATAVDEPGGDVIFSVTVTNTSAVDEVAITDLIDAPYGDITDSTNANITATSCSPVPTLAAGESYSCSFTANVSGNPGDIKTDTVTVYGVDDDNNPLSDNASATVTINNLPSSIEVIKTSDPTSVDEPGDDVTFTVTVMNTSTVDTVTINSLIDVPYGDLNGQGNCVLPWNLSAGASYSCQFTKTVSGNAGDIVTDSVIASGTDDDGAEVSAGDTADVQVNDVPSSASLTKTPTTAVVTFEVVVNNTSPADELELTALNDDVFGDITSVHDNIISTTCSPQTIPVGSSYSCTFTASLPHGDHTDTVTGTLSDNDNATHNPQDSASVNLQ